MNTKNKNHTQLEIHVQIRMGRRVEIRVGRKREGVGERDRGG